MDVSLQTYPLPKEVEPCVLDELWKPCRPQPDVLSLMAQKPNLRTYFSRYYSYNCLRFSRDGGIHISIKTHSDVIGLARSILQDSTRAMIFANHNLDITNAVSNSHATNIINAAEKDASNNHTTALRTALDLCARLITMCDFGHPEFGFSARSSSHWKSHQTLRQATAEYFHPEKKLQPDNPRLRRLFTARHLACIGGIRIRWTTNLMDHLLLSDDDRAVFIFHHADFLRYQSCLADQIFPDGFVDETLRTLTLLFPQNDGKSRRWLVKQISEFSLDPSLSRCGNAWAQDRRFEKFSFWHDRLVILKQTFDDSSPRKLSQWWGDRRNSAQWYTFWVAILVFVTTVFFGLVQSIEGALQVYLSWKTIQQGDG